MLAIQVFLCSVLVAGASWAGILHESSKLLNEGTLYEGATGQPASFEQLAKKLKRGQVLVLGETHDKLASVASQVSILWQLAWQYDNPESRYFKYPQLSVGFEAIDYTQQGVLDDYAGGRLKGAEFWSQIKWQPRLPVELYQFHLQAPRYLKGRALALNAPRWLAHRVSQKGLNSLLKSEKALLPPDFKLGRASYFERFKKMMRGHISDDKLPYYFEAQSLWDDTMAWRATQAMREHPGQVLVIVAGDFHVRYGGGLPDRLRARGLKVVTVSQVFSDDPEILRQRLEPHKVYGPRGDFVLVVDDLELRFKQQPEAYQKLQNLVQDVVSGLLGLLKRL